jgi:hypothetical protein
MGARDQPSRCPSIRTVPTFVGWLVLIVVFGVVQDWFYEVHRRHHAAWRPRSQRWGMPRSDEFRAMLHATFHRDAVPEVERARRIYLLVMALGLAYLLASLFVR